MRAANEKRVRIARNRQLQRERYKSLRNHKGEIPHLKGEEKQRGEPMERGGAGACSSSRLAAPNGEGCRSLL